MTKHTRVDARVDPTHVWIKDNKGLCPAPTHVVHVGGAYVGLLRRCANIYARLLLPLFRTGVFSSIISEQFTHVLRCRCVCA